MESQLTAKQIHLEGVFNEMSSVQQFHSKKRVLREMTPNEASINLRNEK